MAEDQGAGSSGQGRPDVHHVGVVVRNRDAALRRYEEVLGPLRFFTYDREIPSIGVRGERVTAGVHLAFCNLGNILFEVIEPLHGKTIYQEFLDQHGEGLHHMAMVVPDLDAKLERLQALGLQVIMRSTPGARGFAYVEGAASSNVVLEYIQDGPETQKRLEQIWEMTR
jgi:methylmalonyl-CoA/ethylmalonyl-CoA epimerase